MTEDKESDTGKVSTGATIKKVILYAKPIDNSNDTIKEWIKVPNAAVSIDGSKIDSSSVWINKWVDIPDKSASISGMSIDSSSAWFDESYSMNENADFKLSDMHQALKKLKKGAGEATKAVEDFYVQYAATNPNHYTEYGYPKELVKKIKKKYEPKAATYPLW